MLTRVLRRGRWRRAALLIAIGVGLVAAVAQGAAQPGGAPPAGTLSDADQAAALQLALTAPLPYGVDVTGAGVRPESVAAGTTLGSLLQGKRFEAVNAYPLSSPTAKSESLAECQASAAGRCAQAWIYNFTDSVTLSAVVNLTDSAIVAVHAWPHAVPEVNAALSERVLAIVNESPTVQTELAGREYTVAMNPAPAHRDTGPCATDWCVLISLAVEGVADPQEALLVLVNLNEQTTADLFWRSSLRKEN